jgi:integrase
MNARRRKDAHKNLEPNLYTNGDAYRYKNRVTGKFHSLGKDLKAANKAARLLNEKLIVKKDVFSKVLGLDKYTFSNLLDRYEKEYLPTKGLKAGTLKITIYRIVRLRRELGNYVIADLTVEMLSTYLDKGFINDPYIKHRGTLVDVFKWAITKGLSDDNPAEKTLAKNAEKKKRLPLNLEDFSIIRDKAPHWLQIAMDLALVSLQRRGDICALTYDKIQDGRMIVIQEKTEKHGIRARLSIECGPQLEAIIKASRADKVASPFVIHKRPARIIRTETKKHWTQILPDHLSKQFADTRDSIEKFKKMPPSLKPTFHEIRALGGWLYLEQGYSKEYVNLLMGHTKMAMTDHYTDRHMEYTECKAELNINNF